MDEDIVAIIASFLVVFVPVAGITARIALKPLIEAIGKVMAAKQGQEALQMMERRVALLEQELQAVRGDVRQVGEEREFYRRLVESSEPAKIG